MAYQFKTERARQAFRNAPNEDLWKIIALDDKWAKEEEAEQAIQGAQGDINQTAKMKNTLEALGQLDFSKMQTAEAPLTREPTFNQPGPIKKMPNRIEEYAKFDVNTPSGQFGGRGQLMPSQEARIPDSYRDQIKRADSTQPAMPIPTAQPTGITGGPEALSSMANRSLADIFNKRGLTSQYSDQATAKNFMSSQRQAAADRIIAGAQTDLNGEKPNIGKIFTDLAPFADLPNVKTYIDEIGTFYKQSSARPSVFSMQEDTDETKLDALEQIDVLEKTGEYPSVNWDFERKKVERLKNGAYKFFDIYGRGQATTGEKGREEILNRPAVVETKRQEAAASGAAGESAKMTARDTTHKTLGHTNISPSTGEAYTQSQYAAGGYANRIKMAIDDIDRLSNLGFDATTVKAAVLSSKNLNAIKDKNLQQYAQAKRNFINAVMRRESGAAIAPSEFDSAEMQYFPQLNDSKETLEQKRRNRMASYASLSAESGGTEEIIRKKYEEGLSNQTQTTTGTGTKASALLEEVRARKAQAK